MVQLYGMMSICMAAFIRICLVDLFVCKGKHLIGGRESGKSVDTVTKDDKNDTNKQPKKTDFYGPWVSRR